MMPTALLIGRMRLIGLMLTVSTIVLYIYIYISITALCFVYNFSDFCPWWVRGNPTRIPSLPHLLSFSIFYILLFHFSLSYLLCLFSCFSIHFHSTRIVPLCFQAICRSRRQLNLALVFLCADFVLYVFLVKDSCLFLSYLI